VNSIPNFQVFMRPLLDVLAEQPAPIRASRVYDLVADRMGLSEEARQQTLPSGRTRTFRNRIGWASTYLRFADLVAAPNRGHWVITAAGKEVLLKHPGEIKLSLLETLPAYVQARQQVDSEGADEDLEAEEGDASPVDPRVRIQLKMERALPTPTERRVALELLAFAIENADEERSDAWIVQEHARGLVLKTGRLVACEIKPGRVSLTVMGPIEDSVRAELLVDAERDEPSKAVPDAITITFPPERAAKALELLQDGVDAFIDSAMARTRRAVSQENHAREAVEYVASVVGRELPQPEQAGAPVNELDDDGDVVEIPSIPIQRGRAPIFESGNRAVGTLVDEIEREGIALPDMQRPFVWEDAKVRDLLDSLFLGFPVGTLVLWRTAEEREARAFGADSQGLRATTLVIDGQQRLTSLYAVLRGKPVVDKDGTKRQISIGFRPRDGRFEVADAAIRQDPEYLPNITELWTGPRTKSAIKREMLKALADKGRVVTDDYADAVDQNLDRAQLISDFRFPTVEIRPSGGSQQITEEDVAEIFVRINNQGKRLGQADFVLTLLSVFHGQLRDRIELGAKELSEDSVVALDVHQLLRATCAVGFGRARMSAIYSFLRGMDPSSREVDPESRKKRLADLDAAATRCLHTTTWRDFTLRVQQAGFVHPALVGSTNAIVNAYALYALGAQRRVERHELDEVISRWVFGTLLTSRYSSASETAFEQDLARLRDAAEPQAFVATLDGMLSSVVSGDYWTRTLVNDLESQRSRAPAALAFRAAQIVLGAKALFSDQPLGNLLRANGRAARNANEQHHLFPKAWLARTGIKDQRRINQVANLADVGWYDNAGIGADGPGKYVPRLKQKRGWTDEEWGRACVEHALPPDWENMAYDVFLRERRVRMAYLIRAAYRALGGEAGAEPITPPWFLPGAEQVWAQIADTERALRGLVRETYIESFGKAAAEKIESALGATERESLGRALRARPTGADPLSVVDYLYLGQLPALLFYKDVWEKARLRLSGTDAKQKLQAAISAISPVRNEIAHVREVAPERLQRASLACRDVQGLIVSAGKPS
jgi:hypothetical protein